MIGIRGTITEDYDCIFENEDGTYCVDKKKSSTYDTYEEALEVVATRRQEKIQNNAEKCKGSTKHKISFASLYGCGRIGDRPFSYACAGRTK